jgi:hypothetical protein
LAPIFGERKHSERVALGHARGDGCGGGVGLSRGHERSRSYKCVQRTQTGPRGAMKGTRGWSPQSRCPGFTM